MARKRCVSCGGEYDQTLPDGYRYFHACPPVFNKVTGLHVERADKRDENVRLVDDGKGGTVAQAKREGKGAVDAPAT